MTSPRQIAKANGDLFYHSPKPCKRCGETKRYTADRSCVACREKHRKENREARLAYMAEYRKENREAIRAQQVERYKENREAILAYAAEYRKENREAIRAQRAEHYKENREALRAQQNARNAHIRFLLEKARIEGPFEIESNDPREIAAARGQLKFLVNKECPKHPGVFERFTADNKCPICKNVKGAKRRALHKEAEVSLTPEERKEVDAFYAEAKRLAEETGLDHHVDHILPIQKGGIHHPINLRVLPGSENCSKGANIHWEEITPAIARIHLLHPKPKLAKQTLNKLKRIVKNVE